MASQFDHFYPSRLFCLRVKRIQRKISKVSYLLFRKELLYKGAIEHQISHKNGTMFTLPEHQGINKKALAGLKK